MKLTVPSHIVLANLPTAWPAIPQQLTAQADDGTDLPAETVWDVNPATPDMDGNVDLKYDGTYRMRVYRVEDQFMIWVHIADYTAQQQGSYIVFAQAPRRDPTKTRLHRYLKALKAQGIVDKEWRILSDGTYWMSAELNADTGPKPDRIRNKWPASWYPITGYTGTFPNQTPIYNTAYPILGSIFAL
jgi:hypothetical protein